MKEFIELLRGCDIQINWEIKDYPSVEGDEFARTTLTRLIDMINEAGLADHSMINSFSDVILEHAYVKYNDSFTIHGQGIHNCVRSKDESVVSREELYDWCCLYPNVKGERPIDYPENFAWCTDHGILPCVCVPDELDAYRRYIELGCRMFTTNDVIAADEILKSLGYR